jgi:hypothetical protein
MNWENYLNGKLKGNYYSDQNMGSNYTYLDMSSHYTQERNIYTLSGAYDKDSNLNVDSTDFGITSKRVNRRLWNVDPQYQRLLTERLIFSVSYNHTDVDYTDASGAAYVPYATDTLNSSLVYGLTEIDKLSFLLQATDYASKNEAYKYQLFVTRIGIEHHFSEMWSTNLSIGASRRNSTNIATQSFNFFGQPILLTQVSDFSDRSSVLNASLSKKLEAGSFSAAFSRDDVTNSYGGLNEVSTLSFNFKHDITSLLNYSIDTRYEKIKSVSGAELTTDRDIFSFSPQIHYAISRQWAADATYRYVQRKLDTGTVDNQKPHSSTIYIGLTYNFPDISTF